MGDVEAWWEQGERVPVALADGERQIFVRRAGTGASTTLLHGFPSSSHDWAKLAPALEARGELLALDFLGFGASDKPVDHAYSLHEQADIVEAVWAQAGVRSTALVAHDYAVSVSQELLARREEGRLAVELRSLQLLNGGLYPELHRPQPAQLALLDPEQGPRLGELANEELFVAMLAPSFAPSFDARADSADIWRATSRDDGQRIGHLLIRYIVDRQAHAARWVHALQTTDVPLGFVWGMLDPISGAHMAERIRERLPAAPLVELHDVAHWPQLEAPERVLAALLSDM